MRDKVTRLARAIRTSARRGFHGSQVTLVPLVKLNVAGEQ